MKLNDLKTPRQFDAMHCINREVTSPNSLFNRPVSDSNKLQDYIKLKNPNGLKSAGTDKRK